MATKLDQFKGIAPKIAPEQLAEGLAQIASNCKLDSGDIIPYPDPAAVGSTSYNTTVNSIYPLRDPDTDAVVWLSWTDNVNVATPAFEPVVHQQRFYYTGDGEPKVSTYALATSSGPPYPGDYYTLGLPLPEEVPVTVATEYLQRTIVSVARDSGGLVTFNLSSPHDLKTGMFVAIKNFTNYAATYARAGQEVTVTLTGHGIGLGSTVFVRPTSGTATPGAYSITAVTANTFTYTESESGVTSGNIEIDTRSYNTISGEVIVVDDTTVKMFLPGFEQATYATSVGRLELSGTTYARTYTYTWYTPWGEESVGSDPSEDLVIKEGQVVTVTNLPNEKPSVPAKNFIRGIKLYRTLAGLRETDFFLLKTLWFPAPTASVGREGSIVTLTMQEHHNLLEGDRFKLTGMTNSSADITDGIVLSVTDAHTFTYSSAGVAIAEDTADTTGVLYYDVSEHGDDDARYWGDVDFSFLDDFNSKKLTDNLVSDEWVAPPEELEGLTVIQNNVLAGFVNNKLYMSEPSEPHAWPEAYEKILDVNIVAIRALSGVGAVVLTEKQPYVLTGNDPATMTLQKVDTLYPCVSARGAVSMNFGVLYPTYEGLALYSPTGGVRLATAAVYNADTWVEAFDPTELVAVYYDNNYFASDGSTSFVYMYGAEDGGSFVTCDYGFTSAYHDAKEGIVYTVSSDTPSVVDRWDDPAQASQTATWKSKKMLTQDYNNIGAVRVKGDYSGSPDVTFTMWADGVQIYSNPVYNEEVFRLPRGYRADTFEVSVEANTRIRAIHLGENPLSLKEV